ncbi:hypothetical protein CDAR_603911 [Caerostris darwini]|uniref:Uncharacterized protein n=1 Tax=Caerostris darwini TaxID=1538125 RepID=A0AAV4UEC1_9ARAC|nr:hypothetical protein CDAR_603911 [Caerostris darwini]
METAFKDFTHTIKNTFDNSSEPNFNHPGKKLLTKQIKLLIKQINNIKRVWQISRDPTLKFPLKHFNNDIEQKSEPTKVSAGNKSRVTFRRTALHSGKKLLRSERTQLPSRHSLQRHREHSHFPRG